MGVNKSVAEIRNYSQKKEYIAQIREAMKDKMVQLTNLTENAKSETFKTFSKTKLREYQKNPKANEQNLRELSQFLYRMSHQYRRIINYYAEMIDLSAYSVIPTVDIERTVQKKDQQQMLKKYAKTIKQVKKMSLNSEIMKALLIAWREDVFYGYVYEDSDSFFIMPLNGKYCRISSINFDGTLNFAYDFSYFRTYDDDLEYWDDEFRKKYTLYQSDMKNYKWQELDKDRTICLKVNIEDLNLIIPPFVCLFNQIIDLIDLQSIQSVKDELSVYKLLVARLETLSGTDEPDDWAVDVDTAIEYYNKLEDKLPDYVSSCISPLPIDTIEFKTAGTEDVDAIASSMSNLFKAAGVSQVLDSSQLSGDGAFQAAVICDSLQAMKILLPQIEKWHNRYLQNHIVNACELKYLEVTPYTRQQLIDEYKEAAQYGMPVKIAYSTLLGFDPLQTVSLAYLENDCLKLAEKWVPLQSSHTQSGSPTMDDTAQDPASDNTSEDPEPEIISEETNAEETPEETEEENNG